MFEAAYAWIAENGNFLSGVVAIVAILGVCIKYGRKISLKAANSMTDSDNKKIELFISEIKETNGSPYQMASWCMNALSGQIVNATLAIIMIVLGLHFQNITPNSATGFFISVGVMILGCGFWNYSFNHRMNILHFNILMKVLAKEAKGSGEEPGKQDSTNK